MIKAVAKFLFPYTSQPGDTLEAAQAYRNTLRIALPSVAEMFLVSLIGSVDTMMVGALGKQALSAVGLPAQPRLMILCFLTAMNVGVSAVAARRKGENRQEDANNTLRMAILMAIGLSVLLIGIALPLTRPLLQLAGGSSGTPESSQILDDASAYFRILTYALPLNGVTLTICAAQRGAGQTGITFQVNVLSNLVNVLFNYLLIEGKWGFPRLEVRGAAIATDIGALAGFLLALLTVLGRRKASKFLHISLRQRWCIDLKALRTIVKIGGNALIEQIGMRVGFFICGRIYFDMGMIRFATHQICMQVLNLTFAFGDGIGVAGTALVGQYMGKKRPDLAKLYGLLCQRCALLSAGMLFLLLFFCRRPITALYIGKTTPDADQVILCAMQTMIVLAAMQPFQINAFALAGCLRGAGDNLFVAITATLCVSLIRPAMALIAVWVFHFDLPATWVFAMSEMILRCVWFYARFSSEKWEKIQI